MKFLLVDEKIYNQYTTRTWFAFLPIRINDEIRWLEKVTVRGYWWKGCITDSVYWESVSFVNI